MENIIMIKKAALNDMKEMLALRREFVETIAKENIKDRLDQFIDDTKSYFTEAMSNGTLITYLAYYNNELAGCASLNLYHIMPTIDHPTGMRAYLMNVYTREKYRRKGIGNAMLESVIIEGKKLGLRKISLDATKEGRYLYESYGFKNSMEGMEYNFD